MAYRVQQYPNPLLLNSMGIARRLNVQSLHRHDPEEQPDQVGKVNSAPTRCIQCIAVNFSTERGGPYLSRLYENPSPAAASLSLAGKGLHQRLRS